MPARFDDQQSQDSVGDVNRISYSYEVAIVEDIVTCQRIPLLALISKRICKVGVKSMGISKRKGEEDQRSPLAAEG